MLLCAMRSHENSAECLALRVVDFLIHQAFLETITFNGQDPFSG
jgi:hypothetical protein